jgi:hypothetical protein
MYDDFEEANKTISLGKCSYCYSRVFEDEYYCKDIDDNYFCCSKCMDCYNEMVVLLPSNSVKI